MKDGLEVWKALHVFIRIGGVAGCIGMRVVYFQMSRATPRMRAFAERLIADETKRNNSSGTDGPVAMNG